jgi:hypothetical protein
MGYRGYHFTAEPNLAIHPEWVGVQCEIQVKTMCQESWDAQTHEITYKREEIIDKELLDHMVQLSKIYDAIDQQGEILKTQIQRVELEEQRKKDVAAMVYFWMSTELLEELKNIYSIHLSSDDPRNLTNEDFESLNAAIGNYYKDFGVTKLLCYLTALLALSKKDSKQKAMAFRFAKEYVDKNPLDPAAENVIASINWAFNRFRQSVISGQEAIKKAIKAEKNELIGDFKCSLCYWVADAARAGKNIGESLQSQVLKYARELIENYPNDAGYLDTVGFLKIVFGKTTEEVEEGLMLTRKARDLTSNDEDIHLKRLGEAFCARHERLAYLRLAQIVQ